MPWIDNSLIIKITTFKEKKLLVGFSAQSIKINKQNIENKVFISK